MQVESAAEPSEAEKAYSAKLAKLKQVKAFRGPFALPLAALGWMAALQRSVLWLARILFAECAVANTSWCIATLWYAEDSLGTLWHTGAVWRDPHGAAPRVPLPAQPLRPAPPQAGPVGGCNGCRLVRLVAPALAALQRYNSASILLGTTRAANGML